MKSDAEVAPRVLVYHLVNAIVIGEVWVGVRVCGWAGERVRVSARTHADDDDGRDTRVHTRTRTRSP